MPSKFTRLSLETLINEQSSIYNVKDGLRVNFFILIIN